MYNDRIKPATSVVSSIFVCHSEQSEKFILLGSRFFTSFWM